MSTITKIAIIALVVISLGVGLFLYHLGASGELKLPTIFSGLSGFSFLPSGSATTLPTIPKGSSTVSTISGSGSSAPTSLTVDSSTINASEIPSGFTVAQLSPYFHEVRFGTMSAGNTYSYGTIVLNVYFKNNAATGTIDITGWQIKSKNGGEYIPQAVALYDPSGLAAASDIRLKNNDMAYLYSSSAPFNLRINKCIGYIAHVANFQPALPLNCPYTDQSKISSFTGACQNYIQSLSGCSQPNMNSTQIPRTDYACRDYLENNFTYKSCFQDHSGDTDFLSNQVWVWTGSNVIDSYHDVVDLYDRQGLLVDQYTY